MSSSSRFRSISAFTRYRANAPLTPVQLLSVIKAAGGEIRRCDILERAQVCASDIEEALSELLKEGVVSIMRGDTPDDDRILL